MKSHTSPKLGFSHEGNGSYKVYLLAQTNRIQISIHCMSNILYYSYTLLVVCFNETLVDCPLLHTRAEYAKCKSQPFVLTSLY